MTISIKCIFFNVVVSCGNNFFHQVPSCYVTFLAISGHTLAEVKQKVFNLTLNHKGLRSTYSPDPRNFSPCHVPDATGGMNVSHNIV